MTENYKNVSFARNWYLNRLAQIPEYHKSWGGDFCMKESLDYIQQVNEYLTNNVDFTKLTLEEFKSLGFEFFNNKLLCPLWLANHLFPNVDHDHRGGLIAFGYTVDGDTIIFDKTGIR